MACLFAPVSPGSNVLAMDVSPRTQSNGAKLFAGGGAKRSLKLAFLLVDVENMKIVFRPPKMRHGFQMISDSVAIRRGAKRKTQHMAGSVVAVIRALSW
jgi:hypothetical protein